MGTGVISSDRRLYPAPRRLMIEVIMIVVMIIPSTKPARIQRATTHHCAPSLVTAGALVVGAAPQSVTYTAMRSLNLLHRCVSIYIYIYQ